MLLKAALCLAAVIPTGAFTAPVSKGSFIRPTAALKTTTTSTGFFAAPAERTKTTNGDISMNYGPGSNNYGPMRQGYGYGGNLYVPYGMNPVGHGGYSTGGLNRGGYRYQQSTDPVYEYNYGDRRTRHSRRNFGNQGYASYGGYGAFGQGQRSSGYGPDADYGYAAGDRRTRHMRQGSAFGAPGTSFGYGPNYGYGTSYPYGNPRGPYGGRYGTSVERRRLDGYGAYGASYGPWDAPSQRAQQIGGRGRGPPTNMELRSRAKYGQMAY